MTKPARTVAKLTALALLASSRAAVAWAGLHTSMVGHAGGSDVGSKGLFSIDQEELLATHEGWLPTSMGAVS